MSLKPWKILETSRPYKNLRFDKCELPNGRLIEKMVMEFSALFFALAHLNRLG
jgi:hypothetical protein